MSCSATRRGRPGRVPRAVPARAGTACSRRASCSRPQSPSAPAPPPR
jgi:hypothetical protein